MPATAIIPFIFMLALHSLQLPLELVPKQQDIEDGSGPAVMQVGDPLQPTNGPMYAELVRGVINNKVKVFFVDAVSGPIQYYYYHVESSGNMSITTDSDEGSIFQMLPMTGHGELSLEGQFYLGYEVEDSTVVPVNVTYFSAGRHFELMLETAAEEGDIMVPLVGLISPYYHYYLV